MAEQEKTIAFHDFKKLIKTLKDPKAMEDHSIDDNFFIALPSVTVRQIASLGRQLHSWRTERDEDPKSFHLRNVLIRWYDRQEAKGLAEWHAVREKLKGLTGPVLYVSSVGQMGPESWENVDPGEYGRQMKELAEFMHEEGIEAHFIGGLSRLHVFQIHPMGRIRERG